MSKAVPLPPDEEDRLRNLLEYEILDTPPERAFDDITLLACRLCDTPIASVTFIDADRQWVKSRVGETVRNCSRNMAFCSHAILGTEVFTVPDAKADPRFAENPVVTGSDHIRFYAGAPLVTPEGHVLGTLCVLDRKERGLDSEQAEALTALSRQIVDQLRLRKTVGKLSKTLAEQQRVGEKLAHLAQHDTLTGLPNRSLFKERVNHCILAARQDANSAFAVLFMDLDSFKVINDSLGHHVGDSLLISIARRLEECLKDDPAASPSTAINKPPPLKNGVTVARMGGDEFTVLLDGLSAPTDARAWADRILRELGKPCELDGHEIFTNVSIGIASGNRSYQNAGDLLRDADAAMYRAKAAGKNCCVQFDSHMLESVVVRMRIGADLRHAVDRNELVLHYQPIVSLDTRRLVGFEALVRWKREGKLISPADFIPVAEDTGLIVPIGTWVLREACRQVGQWRAAHPALGPLSMSVNLSRKQFNDPALFDHVREVIEAGYIEAQNLKLEVTESVVMEDTEAGRTALARIKALGVGLQMDDFGTGYSSLSFLHRFPLDALKIDRSFIKDVASRRDAVAMLQAIITLAHNLRMKVVGEGLELPEQVALLQALDCDYGQGYLFAKPLEPAMAERFALTSLLPAIKAG